MLQCTRCPPPLHAHTERSSMGNFILWSACNHTAFTPCLTCPVDYSFASRYEGPRFNPQGGTYVKPGFSCQRCLATISSPLHSPYMWWPGFQPHTQSVHSCSLRKLIQGFPCFISCMKMKIFFLNNYLCHSFFPVQIL